MPVTPQKSFRALQPIGGKEFSCYPIIEAELEIPVYFADPYAAWQRGNNENGNGLFREFFPKGTNFDIVSPEEIDLALALINNRPRKCLKWKTPHGGVHGKVLHLI